MFQLLFKFFLIAHGLVHFLYLGHSLRLFELSPGMVWPDRSWVFSKQLGPEGIRRLASGFALLAGLGFVVGGLAALYQVSWWRQVVIVAAVFSTDLYFLFWDRRARKLPDQGLIAVLINIAVFIFVFL
jgi:hypothetical protein